MILRLVATYIPLTKGQHSNGQYGLALLEWQIVMLKAFTSFVTPIVELCKA